MNTTYLYDFDTNTELTNVQFPFKCEVAKQDGDSYVYFDGNIPYTDIICSTENQLFKSYYYALLLNNKIVAIGYENNWRDGGFISTTFDKDFYDIKNYLKNSCDTEKLNLYYKIENNDLITDKNILPKCSKTLFKIKDNNGNYWYGTEDINNNKKNYYLWKMCYTDGKWLYKQSFDKKEELLKHIQIFL